MKKNFDTKTFNRFVSLNAHIRKGVKVVLFQLPSFVKQKLVSSSLAKIELDEVLLPKLLSVM